MSPFVLTDCCCSISVLQAAETSGMKTREDSTGLHIWRNRGHVLVGSELSALTRDQRSLVLPSLSAKQLLTPHSCLQSSAVHHFSTIGSDEA